MMLHFRVAGLAAAVFACCLAFEIPAKASIIQISSLAALGPSLPIDWGVFGPDGTGISTPDSRMSRG